MFSPKRIKIFRHLRLLLKAFVFVCLFFIMDTAIYEVLKHGIVKYYGLDKSAQIVCVGHSHMVLGIDSERLEKELGVQVAKYAIAGANAFDRFWMIKHYVHINPHVQTVVYDVDARLFDSHGLSSASYTLFLPFLDDGVMSQYLRQQTSWQEYCTSRIIKSARFRDQTLNIALRGLFGRTETIKTSQLQPERYHGYIEKERKRKVRIHKQTVDFFHDTLKYVSSRGVNVILLFVPVVDLLNEIDTTNQRKALQIFYQAAETNPNVYFLNYRDDFQHDYSLFFDPRHLNDKGKQAITKRLIDDLQTIVKKNGVKPLASRVRTLNGAGMSQAIKF